MLGTVRRGQMVSTQGARPGDLILLVGGVPVEGTSIIAREKRTALLAAGWSPATLDEAAGYLHEPGISVLAPALTAARRGLVTAMHDPTEGGIATGLLELALAAGVGLAVDLDAIPVPPLAARLCQTFGLDPLGTIASGALLATAPQMQIAELQALWSAQGWGSAIIGRVTPQAEGVNGYRAGVQVEFPTFAVDEITKLWAT
jgi:hydrogenase expression/formation protein HypE